MPPITDLKNLERPIRVGVILVNSVTEILDIAPVDIFSGLSKEFVHNFPEQMLPDHLRKQALDVEFYWVTENGQEAKVTAGATIRATHDFETCPPLDITLMGAHETGYVMTEGETAFLRKCNNDCIAQLFICGGFLAALQAGLLAGKTATAPRPMVGMLCQGHPEVDWVAKRWVQDGKIWTSGALLNGTDMTKAFAESVWGREGNLVEFAVKLGGYPHRDVDYKDVPWEL